MIAPAVFAAGLFTILSVALEAIIDATAAPVLAFVVAAAIAYLLSLRIDIDAHEFSMHYFYKNRLVRCYLGASAQNRTPNAFTGFDRNDDVRLATFANLTPDGEPRALDAGEIPYNGPYPILNTTLNLAYGEQLAWQQRKGASFVFTPRYCGFSNLGVEGSNDSYRPTCKYAKEGGLAIGTPLAASGAAVSPNWGYHTSPTVAFLLTVFNVRLGWWLGNPARDKWQRTGPSTGLLYLATELFGFANAKRRYVYLSDGGHFDNMGLYELVRRRCRFIIVCDGEEDHAYTFGGIGSAIRQCRADFGVEIDIDFDGLRPHEARRSRRHWAWSGMFRVTWTICGPTYGTRFANFCREWLELDRGELRRGYDLTSVEALNGSNLSFLERNRIADVIALAPISSFTVTPFEIRVRDPRSFSNEISFPVGFALTSGGELWYFRIQNHVRKMGLGRKALALAIGNRLITSLATPPQTPEAMRLWPPDRVRNLTVLYESAKRLACEKDFSADSTQV